MDVSRRRAIAGVAGVALSALAGCGGQPPRRTSTAMFVTNTSDQQVTVTLRVYELPAGVTTEAKTDTETETGTDTETPDASRVLARKDTLAPEGQYAIDGADLPEDDLRLQVTTEEGPESSYEWERVDERSTIDVRIGDASIRFVELD